MLRQEIDQDIELDKMDNTSGDENPYRELIVNNAGKIETTLSQMEQWSILRNVNKLWTIWQIPQKLSHYVCQTCK